MWVSRGKLMHDLELFTHSSQNTKMVGNWQVRCFTSSTQNSGGASLALGGTGGVESRGVASEDER